MRRLVAFDQRLVLTSLILFCVSDVSIARAAVLEISTAAGPFEQDEEFTSEVLIDPQAEDVLGVDFRIRYPAGQVEVMDASSDPGTQIEAGELFALTFMNVVDEVAGEIAFSQVLPSVGSAVLTKGMVARITFRARERTSPELSFNYGPGDPRFTVIAGRNGVNLLREVMIRGESRCSDSVDNDGDGLTDFPADPECGSPEGTSEAIHEPPSSIELSVPGGLLEAGEEITASLTLDSQGGELAGVDLEILYDPTILRVIDDLPALEGVQVRVFPLFEADSRNEVDSASGRIHISQLAPVGRTYIGRDTLALVRLAVERPGFAEMRPRFVPGSGSESNAGRRGLDTLRTASLVTIAECGDGRDNDDDSLADYPSDPDCADSEDRFEAGAVACSDGVDNDGDEGIDSEDLGCVDASDESERGSHACDDGDDNDGDGLSDFPADPGCPLPYAHPENPGCNDGADNDLDGLTDFDDPECTTNWPYWEKSPCGLGAELALALPLVAIWRRRRGC